jgi:hypothetical protein
VYVTTAALSARSSFTWIYDLLILLLLYFLVYG